MFTQKKQKQNQKKPSPISPAPQNVEISLFTTMKPSALQFVTYKEHPKVAPYRQRWHRKKKGRRKTNLLGVLCTGTRSQGALVCPIPSRQESWPFMQNEKSFSFCASGVSCQYVKVNLSCCCCLAASAATASADEGNVQRSCKTAQHQNRGLTGKVRFYRLKVVEE